MLISRQIIYFQGKAYILRAVKLDNPNMTGDNLDIANKWFGTDKVLRKDGKLHFLEEIEDIEILGEEKNN